MKLYSPKKDQDQFDFGLIRVLNKMFSEKYSSSKSSIFSHDIIAILSFLSFRNDFSFDFSVFPYNFIQFN